MLVPAGTVGPLGPVSDATALACAAAVWMPVLEASGSAVAAFVTVPEMPPQGWLGTAPLLTTDFAVIVSPQGTETVLFEATAQEGAEIDVQPVRLTPVPLVLSANEGDEEPTCA